MDPNFEPVIEYGQRLCLYTQSKRDKSVLFNNLLLIIFIFFEERDYSAFLHFCVIFFAKREAYMVTFTFVLLL